MSVPTHDPEEPSANEDIATAELSDKRHSLRVPCNIPVEYELKGRPQQGQLTNIGTGGASLSAPVSIPVGTTLVLRFPLPPSNRPIQAVGKVKWEDQQTLGVEFVGLNPWEAQEIWKFYAREAAREKGQGR